MEENIVLKLNQFREEIKGKSKEELLALRKSIMDAWSNDGSDDMDMIDLLNDEQTIVDIAKTSIIEEAVMRIDVPSGEINIEYVDGTTKKVKLFEGTDGKT